MLKFQEKAVVDDDVEILAGPLAVNRDGAVGTAQITRTKVRAFVSKEERAAGKKGAYTGEEHVHLVFTPSAGRAEKIRLTRALAALKAFDLVVDAPAEDGDDA